MQQSPSAPVEPIALDAALRPFGQSRGLPAGAFTDRAVFDWESRHLFAGGWTCLGRADEAGAGQTQRAVTVGDIGVLLTFAADRVRAFANVCRHRGHELLPDGGTAGRGAVVCPYHGWAFGLDGSLTTSGDNWELPGVWVGGSMDLRDHAETMSFDGRGAGVFIEGAPRRTVRYVALFPNLLISAHPDYVMTHRLWPVEPGLTEIECCWYFPAEITDPAYAVDFWDLTNRQDWAACESVQRGLSSPHFRPGPLAPNESAVYQWTTLIARAYADGHLGPG